MRSKRLTIAEKKEIFHDLVSTQDTGVLTVAQSRDKIAKQHGITESQLRQIEEEGLENEWPPLDEVAQRAG